MRASRFFRVAAFLAVGAVLLTGLEFTARRLFRPDETKLLSTSIYDNPEIASLLEKENIQIMVLGNSHSFHAVKAERMRRRAYNFAYGAQDLYYSLAVFEKFRPKLHSAKYLVMNVSSFAFGYRMSDNHKTLIPQYTRLGIPEEAAPAASALSSETVVSPLLPEEGRRAGDRFRLEDWFLKSWFYRYRLFFVKRLLHLESSRLLPPEPPPPPKAAFANLIFHLKEALHPVTAKERAKYYMEEFYDARYESREKAYLRALFDEALGSGMKVFLVKIPVTEDYKKNLDAEFLKNHRKNLAEVLSSYEKNPRVVLLDLSKAGNFGPDDFFDPDHLNDAGAEKFTKLLDAAIEKNA